MAMKAFEVSLNGQRLCTAGAGDDGVLATGITWVGGSPPRPASELTFRVGGIDSATGEYLDWPVPQVNVGDEITIRIVETESIDPANRRPKAEGSGESPADPGGSIE
jgi:hypothetical protein